MVNYQTAVRLYYLDQIAFECGASNNVVKGGTSRLTGLRSVININSIIATKSLHKLDYSAFTPSLNNSSLFMRDANTCMYCGNKFSYGMLSRDHVIPLSREVMTHGQMLLLLAKDATTQRRKNSRGG